VLFTMTVSSLVHSTFNFFLQKYGGKKFHNQPDKEGEEVKVFINLRTAPSLGCR
jgi:hypothetical protein